jgi:glycosyltransferase involved in cell wall biosynthesis
MPKNRGKAEAVQAGVSRLSSDYIFLLDADLVGIRPGEFNQALRTIKTRPQIDMLVLRRIKKSWITRRLRGDVLITGERILYRDRLLNALKDQSVHGFQLEVALNQYALDQQWTVCWFPVSSLGEISFKKIGILGGLLKEVRMFYSLFSYLGVRGFIRQYRFFGQELIEKVG